MILTALMKLGIEDVREVAVAGDTESDMVSARRAGASDRGRGADWCAQP